MATTKKQKNIGVNKDFFGLEGSLIISRLILITIDIDEDWD
ncbi:MAG: hypothetical protein AAB842_02700 [Patescibacteria group bacterium]